MKPLKSYDFTPEMLKLKQIHLNTQFPLWMLKIGFAFNILLYDFEGDFQSICPR